ncbi:MAG: ribosomal RNA small subunit methyltransferase A [Phycisphaera sp.]|nr:ribosomal RNA small subunit methyltransferase A [Phycisphaera sp.]
MIVSNTPMQTLSDIRGLLDAHGIHPKHRFGQNFLHDPNKLRDILAAAAIEPGDAVLEVGPGTGVLTEPMLAAGGRVVAVEIDDDMAGILRERIGEDCDGWTLVHADVMAGKHAINPDVVAALDGASFKLVANLPYNVAGPLLATLATDHPTMASAIVMIQREVAERIVAAPGGKEYGPLTVILQAMCTIDRVTTLSPNCFWPRPKVDSAVIRLVRRDTPLTDDPHALSAFLQRLFQKRRKQIGAILGRDTLPNGFDPTLRPEQLSVERLIALADAYRPR